MKAYGEFTTLQKIGTGVAAMSVGLVCVTGCSPDVSAISPRAISSSTEDISPTGSSGYVLPESTSGTIKVQMPSSVSGQLSSETVAPTTPTTELGESSNAVSSATLPNTTESKGTKEPPVITITGSEKVNNLLKSMQGNGDKLYCASLQAVVAKYFPNYSGYDSQLKPESCSSGGGNVVSISLEGYALASAISTSAGNETSFLPVTPGMSGTSSDSVLRPKLQTLIFDSTKVSPELTKAIMFNYSGNGVTSNGEKIAINNQPGVRVEGYESGKVSSYFYSTVFEVDGLLVLASLQFPNQLNLGTNPDDVASLMVGTAETMMDFLIQNPNTTLN